MNHASSLAQVDGANILQHTISFQTSLHASVPLLCPALHAAHTLSACKGLACLTCVICASLTFKGAGIYVCATTLKQTQYVLLTLQKCVLYG